MMARNEAYLEAEQKIEEALRSGATELNLNPGYSAGETAKLTELPASVGKLTHLQVLRLSGNQLSVLPKSINLLTKLQRLDLSGNQLKELPSSLRSLTQLQALDLSRNLLTDLPDWLGQFTQLQSLDIGNNQLTSLPESLSNLQDLRYFDLNSNQVSPLPPFIADFKKLERINIFSNGLTVLPEWIGQLTHLRDLAMGNNPICDLPTSLSACRNLVRLDLGDAAGGCPLTKFPAVIRQLLNLTELFADDCGFDSLPDWLGQLVHLEYVDLNDNQLTAIPESLKQLTKLKNLGLAGNQLTILPGVLGHLTQLRSLNIYNNPLPPEILRLETEGKLIPYLRELSQQGKQPPRLFNEAKLLFVGPGEVGKTWLLQALQGKIPQSTSSTKGLEISREPLDLPHPSEKDRTLHFNCWDFGGQEHYQITHQIFFSPKAIYLLVWKPRPGADPDLVARIERIQLSAGQSAKVFIVSTHADSNVPAVLGQDALRERFGDLIEGFYEVDSGKGPNGTGIATLKSAIAHAAAQLEGMDIPYPSAWHAAQTVVCDLKKPTITFREFSDICIARGMNVDNCEGLASVMDVLGNAVFFSDAPQSDEACVKAEENLVVLDPEWLAKAVTFVLEDQPTRNNSGILQHSRLRLVWRKDARRGCPGYKKNLFGYLLWMMWKFDIAYKQNEQTSLVPEMIHRDRPDDLQWIPATPPREPQATLICKIPQDPPAGLIPALTAAVHPLRSVQNIGNTDDHLDRNWRDGFFLDTYRRGSAFVELVDRDLQIVVRHNYPRDLCFQIRKTLDRIKEDRWPQLNLDYRVPCVGRIDDKKPCPGTFKWEYLAERRGRKVSCQHCNSDEIEVDKMLEGFNAYEEEIMWRLRELKTGQSDFMVQALSYFRAVLDPARSELERAPNMFTILPADVSGWNLWSKVTEKRVRVTCWCEHPDGPHPASVIGSEEPPDYVLTSPQDWLVKAAPYISWATVLLKAFVPLAGSVAKAGLDEVLPGGLKTQIDLMSEASKALPSGKLELGRQDDLESLQGHQPEIVALRHIHDTLLAQVSEKKRWGDLRPVRTKSNQLLWLCAEHAALQQPPVPQI